MRIIDCQQHTVEWYDARLGVPTASEFGDIITPKTGKLSASADAYIDRLIDEIVRPDVERGWAGNRHTERGNLLEPDARELYAFMREDAKLRQVGFIVRDDGRAGCSPDSLVEADDDGEGGLEIKCPDGPTHIGYLRAGTLPDKYKPQVHGSLVITGRSWWDFMSYCPGYKPLIVRVTPDDYTRKLADCLDEFLDRLDAAKAQFIEPQRRAA